MRSFLGTPPAQQDCLHQASCLEQWYQDAPKCSSLITSVLGPVSQECYSFSQPSCKATAPVPLRAQNKGHRTGSCRHHGAELASEAGLESIHPTGKVVMDGCWGYSRGKQAGGQLEEIPSFKGMTGREAIHGALAPMATGERTQRRPGCATLKIWLSIFTHAYTQETSSHYNHD